MQKISNLNISVQTNSDKTRFENISSIILSLSGCLGVCLYPINVETAEPIGPKFFVEHLGSPGKVYESLKFQIFVSIKIRFLKILKIHEFFFENPRNFFVVICLQGEALCILFLQMK